MTRLQQEELVHNVLKRFIKFCDEYMDPGLAIEDLEAYKLKRNHTLRVYDAARGIVKLQDSIDDETKMIILLSSILHDVGRFEQWRKTHSYSDVADPKHPEIGAIMLENGYIEQFIHETRQYDDIIILAVREHGSLELPEGMTDKERLVCQVVRDADRMDIFYQCTTESDFPILYSQKWGEANLSEAVKKCFEAGESVKFADVNSKFDMLALRFALCKQMATEASKRYILEKDYVNKMVDFFKNKLTDENGHFHYDVEELEWLRNNTIEYLEKD